MGGGAVFLVRNVTKKYDSRTILKDINLDVQKGEILGVIGASGAGKTTLLNMLVGFVRSTSGSITFQLGQRQHDVMRQPQLVARNYGFASQRPSFYEKLTVLENLYYFGRMYDLSVESIEKNARQLLHFMNLKPHAHLLAEHLSGGMQRRLDIACALIHNPPVLILDEPTADLDPVLRTQLWEIIKQVNHKGTTVVLSSHHLNDLDALCNRIAIVKDGSLVDVDSPEKLKSKYSRTQDIMVESFPGNYEQIIRMLKPEKDTVVRHEGTYLTIRTPRPEKVISTLLSALKRQKESLLDLKLIKPNIDDVFVKIYEDRK